MHLPVRLVIIASLMQTISYGSISSPAAINAYKNFWNNFDQYESYRLQDTKEGISQSWDIIKKEFHQVQRTQSESQIIDLKAAAKQYRSHLEKFSNAHNKPFVLLNLAQILNNLAYHHQEFDLSSGTNYHAEALQILSDLNKQYPQFEKREDVLYLKATILDSINRKKSAQKTWESLAKIAKNTIFGAHAHIAVGDRHFDLENAPAALSNYKKALRIIRSLKIPSRDYEILRTQYRIAWAAYRSANLTQCIQTGIELLQPGRSMKNLSLKKNIEEDATDLIADALFEKKDMKYIKSTLKNKILRNYASRASLRILKQYLRGDNYTDIIALGEFSVEYFPRSRELPDVLSILSTAYKNKGYEDGYLRSLEKLSLLLPNNSLWRSLYKNEFQTIQNMETKALEASEYLAAHYYKIGIENASASSFSTSSSYYRDMVDFNRDHPRANLWRLKQANSYYFSSDLTSAKQSYSSLIDDQKIDSETLKAAAYQLVLTHEKQWQERFGKILNQGRKPYDDPNIKKDLKLFEDAARAYSNRFTNSRLSIEALLKIASAYRDMKNFTRASIFWQRVLVSNPNPSQRSIAIRGIVFEKIQAKDPKEIIKTVTTFLKLEDWSKLGTGLRQELYGILTQSTLELSDQLNAQDKVAEAATLLLSTAEDFPKIPKRDDIYRDGVYMLAIAGDWIQALRYSDLGLDLKTFKHKSDLAYLKARSLEYQMRFPLAAEAYLSMAESYPSHARAGWALDRAEKLAEAEDKLPIAARANAIKGRSTKDREEKLKYYTKAAQLYALASHHQKALKYCTIALRFAPKWNDKLPVMLISAKEHYAQGSEIQGLRQYTNILRLASRHRDQLDEKTFGELVGETSFLLGEEQKIRFNELRISESRRSWRYNLEKKAEIFDKLYAAYEASINSNHPLWSSQSRYYVARTAEAFSQEISEASMGIKKISASKRTDLKEQSNRLKRLAQKLYSDNLLEKNRRPHEYRSNPWIKKSIIKLAKRAEDKALKIDDEKLPYSIGSFIPLQWSI